MSGLYEVRLRRLKSDNLMIKTEKYTFINRLKYWKYRYILILMYSSLVTRIPEINLFQLSIFANIWMEDPVSGRRGSTPNFDDVGKMMEDHFYENECKYDPYK